MVSRRVTLKDVARHAGVSYQTVSKVLRNKMCVSEETCNRIYSAVAELGYRPNMLGRNLREARTRTLGFFLPAPRQGMSDPFFNEMLVAIAESASTAGYDLLLSIHSGHDDEVEALKWLVRTARFDGLLLHEGRVNDPRVAFLVQERFPFVLFGRTGMAVDYAYVDVDGLDATYRITKHLLEKGHRLLAFVGSSPEYFYVKDRLAGFSRALQESGLPVLDELVLLGYNREFGGYEAFGRLLTSKRRPTAVVCTSDLLAIGVMRRACESGLRVGRDVAVTGFDEISLAAYTSPPLTTVKQPIATIARLLVEIVSQLVEEGEEVERQKLVVKGEVILRASSGA